MFEVKGQCLCEEVQYTIALATSKLNAYQCHCSICRTATGTVFSCSTFIPIEYLKFEKGMTSIREFERESGYKIAFCSNCSSPVPNLFRDYPYYSTPIGGLDLSDITVKIIANLCLDDQVLWNNLATTGVQFSQLPPNVQTVIDLLNN